MWEQSNGASYSIWSNLYTPGTGWGTAVLVENDNTGNTYVPNVAFDRNGNAIAVWHLNNGTRTNVWASRYTAGTGWGTATPIEADTGTAVSSSAQIGFDASGNALVVWYQSDGTRNNIWSNRYTAGTGWSTAALIETDNAGDAYYPQIAVDASGYALAVWSQNDGIRFNIHANRYTVGTGWGTPELIESDNAGIASAPQIAMDASGNAMAAWWQYNGMHTNIYANRYTVGTGWSSAILIDIEKVGDAINPQIGVDAKGNALAVRQQFDGSRNNIWANRFQ